MKDNEILCDICTAPMEVIDKKYAVSNRGAGKYRIRRFKCIVCDYQKSLYGVGIRDEILEPYNALKQSERQFKEEVEARK